MSAAIIQSDSDLLAVNVSTSLIDPAFAPLLAVTMSTVGGDLLVWFTFSGSYLNTMAAIITLEFRLLLDGVARSAAGTCMFNTLAGSAMVATCLTGVSAGEHTVAIEWGMSPGTPPASSAICRPATLPNREHASLVVAEVLQ
jgi:hypothetical protein